MGWVQGGWQIRTCRQSLDGGKARLGEPDRSLAKEQGAVLRQDLIAEAAMRALRIVLLPERTGDGLRFQHAAEQLPIKAFVAEAAIEALIHAVLPRAARLVKADPDASLRQTFLQRPGHELSPVVAPQGPRRTAHPDRRLQRPDHFRGPQLPAGDDNRCSGGCPRRRSSGT